jgi:hypothetical protein
MKQSKLEKMATTIKNGPKILAAGAILYGASCAPSTEAIPVHTVDSTKYACEAHAWYKPDSNTFDIDISHPDASMAVWDVWYMDNGQRVDVFKDAEGQKAYQSGFGAGLEMHAIGRAQSGDCYATFTTGK